MITHRFEAGERRYIWWPFWGVGDLVPDVRIGDGPWTPLEADPTFTPTEPIAPPGAKWFRGLFAHPATQGNTTGTIVIPLGSSRLRHRITGSPEVEIPDPGEYIAAVNN